MSEDRPSKEFAIRVMMATTSFPTDESDWKGRFIHDMAAALDAVNGVELLLWGPPGRLPGSIVSVNTSDDSRWFEQIAADGGIAHLLRTHPLQGTMRGIQTLARLRSACRRNPVDLYHANWMQLVLGLPDDARPVYVAVLGSDFGLLRIPGMKSVLRNGFKKRRTLLAPNADWMVEPLTRQFGDVAEIRLNPFGVASEWFEVKHDPVKPYEWLVVARVTRKKLGELLNWGQGIFNHERRLKLLGPMQEQLELPPWIEYSGTTNPDDLRSHWFPRATGLITLSQHDEGRPQIMIEAMAAGLPIVANRAPAHTDLIKDGETGYLVSDKNGFADALLKVETAADGSRVGYRASTWIRERIGTWNDHTMRCIEAYTDLSRGRKADA